VAVANQNVSKYPQTHLVVTVQPVQAEHIVKRFMQLLEVQHHFQSLLAVKNKILQLLVIVLQFIQLAEQPGVFQVQLRAAIGIVEVVV
jgi:hypothetical protein